MPETALTPTAGKRSILEKLSVRFSMEPGPLQSTLAKTIFPQRAGAATPEQVAALCIVADQYDLNPFTREIYAFPDKQGGIVPVLSVDGWYKIINRHPEFDGLTIEMGYDGQGHPASCTCTIHRKDRRHPTVITEYLEECKRNTPPWQQSPRRMLRHRAIAQCARVAFGFAVMEADEAEAYYAREPDFEVSDRPRSDTTPKLDLKTVEAELKKGGVAGTVDTAASKAAAPSGREGSSPSPATSPEPPESLKYEPPASWNDETRDPAIPWEDGQPHGGYPYDVTTSDYVAHWQMEPIGGRRKDLKELRWYEVDSSTHEAHPLLVSVVKDAAQRDSQTEMERRAAIWLAKIKRLESSARSTEEDDDPFATWGA